MDTEGWEDLSDARVGRKECEGGETCEAQDGEGQRDPQPGQGNRSQDGPRDQAVQGEPAEEGDGHKGRADNSAVGSASAGDDKT